MTAICYLNDIEENHKEGNGYLRVFTEENIVDIAPCLGRLVLFKSEVLEHEVLATKGFERYAVTCWFHTIVKSRFPAQFHSENHNF